MATRRLLKVVNLGRLGYRQALEVQRKYAANHISLKHEKNCTQSCDTLLLVEHDPVYTVGLRSHHYCKEEGEKLAALGAEYHTTDRGGLITFHGPGQLVAYPVLNLAHFTPSVKWYVGALEAALVRTCGVLGVEARVTRDVGVWVGERKVAAIGVHATRYITTHGVSLNCNVDLSWYDHIVACGLHGKEVTSLSKELSREITLSEVIKPFTLCFGETFGCEIESEIGGELDGVGQVAMGDR